MNSYLYVISRKDLSIEQQAVQATHAAIEYVYHHPNRPIDNHPTLVHLTVNNKWELEQLQHNIYVEHGIHCVPFYESYQDIGLTAISCLVDDRFRKMFSHLKLWTAKPS